MKVCDAHGTNSNVCDSAGCFTPPRREFDSRTMALIGQAIETAWWKTPIQPGVGNHLSNLTARARSLLLLLNDVGLDVVERRS